MGRRVNLAELATDDIELTAERTTDWSTSRLPDQVGTYPVPGSGTLAAVPSTPDETPTPAVAPDAGVNAVYTGELASRLVPIDAVTFNPLNKRPPGDDDELEDLAETIRAHGVIQPLVVCSARAYRERFPDQDLGEAEWVALIGNRRLRAARLAGRTEVSIVVNDERVTSMYEVMLVENGQRRDLPPWLEAEAMAEVLAAAAISQRELARRIGKSAMYITHRLALLKLVAPLRSALEAGELTLELAREFGELAVAEQEAIVAGGRPYRRPRPADGGLTTRAAVRSIRVSSPAVAAAAIRKAFSADELAELVRLLTGPTESAASESAASRGAASGGAASGGDLATDEPGSAERTSPAPAPV